MKATVTLTVASGLPRVSRGTVVALRYGDQYVVKKQTHTTLSLVPYRWWHKVPWMLFPAFALGVALGFLLSRWW